MENFISDPFVKIYVCESFFSKVGILVIRRSAYSAEIVGIAVSEKARHIGIGKQMILNAMESEHLKRLDAQTDDSSIGFYIKCGFDEERIVKEYPDGSAVRYKCSLIK